jgi:hypothetical protein
MASGRARPDGNPAADARFAFMIYLSVNFWKNRRRSETKAP